MKRGGIERMQDVGQEQFLMLFLMVDAQFDPLDRFRIGFLLQQTFNSLIDVSAEGEDFLQRRSGKRGAQALFRKRCEALVIAVEQPRKIRIEEAISGLKLTQNEGLKEPCG